jgi:uncharacterized membrane protein YedE/YeeE
MTIAWQQFTPYSALIGGALIGLSASLFVLLNGRVAGISGILGGLLRPQGSGVVWRLAFLAGLIGAPILYQFMAPQPTITVDADNILLICAELLVGVGTRYGAGCTSGHGVCGLSRLSIRSLVATLTFMTVGFATVFIMRHVIGK